MPLSVLLHLLSGVALLDEAQRDVVAVRRFDSLVNLSRAKALTLEGRETAVPAVIAVLAPWDQADVTQSVVARRFNPVKFQLCGENLVPPLHFLDACEESP